MAGEEEQIERGNQDGLVQGTSGADQIDSNYDGDPEGDKIDDGIAFSADIDDMVVGADGDDTIYAGDGDDYARGEGGDDKIWLGDGDDRGSGNAGDDKIFGQDGQDFLTGGDGEDFLHGGKGKDVLYGGNDDDTLCGDDGDDQLYGNAGADLVIGGAGNDEVLGGAGDDSLHGCDGDDKILGEAGDDTLTGGDGNDMLIGGDGDDVLYGGAGNDYMKGSHGSDSFHIGVNEGGPYNDIVNGGMNTDVPGFVGASNASGIDKLYVEGPVSVTLFDDDGNFVRTVDLQVGEEVDLEAENLDDGLVTLSDGSTITFSNIEQIHVVEEVQDPEECDKCICFTPGTQIATIGGLVPVDQLKLGDRVITRDNGYQEIRWIGRKKLSAGALAMQPHLKPVMIRAGALGPDLPERDMMVSPQHRMLLTNAELMLHFGESEVLVPAKHLLDGKGVSRADSKGVEYIHILFDHHEVILADGAWTESFQPGDYSIGALDSDARAELHELFPELANPEGQVAYAASRPTLKAREVEMRNALSA